VGNFNFGVAARLGSVYRIDNTINMQFHVRPLLVAKYNNRNFPVRQIPLISNIFVSREQQFDQ
jgi:hypothetical protein